MHKRKRTVLLVPFGVVTGAMVAASAAFACGTLIGSFKVTGDATGSTVGTMTATGSKHGTPTLAFSNTGPGVPPKACLAKTGLGDCAVAGNGFGYVDIETGANNGLHLPPSAGDYHYGGASTPDNPCPGAGVRCVLGGVGPGGGPLPPLTVDPSNDVGDYYVTLMQGPTYVDNPQNGVDVADRQGAPCANPFVPPSQHVRVVHLAHTTIGNSGELTNVVLPSPTVNRPSVGTLDPLTPVPASQGGNVWRVYLPPTQAAAGTNASGPVFGKVCINDRYGIVSAEVPLSIVAL